MFEMLLATLILPSHVSAFENDYLKRMNRLGLGFFLAHIPALTFVAWFNETGAGFAALLSAFVAAGPLLAYRTLRPRGVPLVYGFAAMLMGGALVHFGQGPMQIEMHFYFFALIAALTVYGNPMVICVATATVAVHHLVLWVLLPASVFNYSAPIWVVLVHAGFVVLEAVATCFIARSFFDNVIGLEKIVAARTQQLDERNRDLRLVLDNVAQGFLTLDENGQMSAEKSAAVQRWLGPAEQEQFFGDYLARVSKDVGDAFRLGWEQVRDDLLPLELTLGQLPKRLHQGELWYALQYSPIAAEGATKSTLVVISDVTETVIRERLEEQQREVLGIFDHVLRDRAGFIEFFCEADQLVQEICSAESSDLSATKRAIHTLRGNTSIFEIHTIARLCNDMETQIADEREPPTAALRAELANRWEDLRSKLDALLGERTLKKIEIEDAQYDQLLSAVLKHEPAEKLARLIASWKLEPTAHRLARVASQARGIAARLNKGGLQVTIEDHQLRTDPEQWSSFWSAFVHVIRNAVDHGIEPARERPALGKVVSGHIVLATRLDANEFVIEVRDDGRGINWQAVAAKATEIGIPHQTREDLIDALFSDGLTTANEVGEFSGRGVGMGAARAACTERGGRVEVFSHQGDGTRIEFRFPRSNVSGPSGSSLPAARPIAS